MAGKLGCLRSKIVVSQIKGVANMTIQRCGKLSMDMVGPCACRSSKRIGISVAGMLMMLCGYG